MTAKKDLKRRIRARQAETGESYVTARRHVVARAPAGDDSPEPASTSTSTSAIVVEEMVDLTADAAALGFRCRVMTSSLLAGRVDAGAMLRRLRDIVHGTTEDPAMERIRAVVLRGESVGSPRRGNDWLERTRQFVQRARVGVGGVSAEGAMLAFPVDDPAGSVMVIANTGFRMKAPTADGARLVLSAIVEEGFSAGLLYVR